MAIKEYVAFFAFMISMCLWTAANDTINTQYFAANHGLSAGTWWFGTLLITIVFFIGLAHMGRAARQQEASGQLPYPAPKNPRNWILFFSSLFWGLSAVERIQTCLTRLNAPQLPSDIKFWFAVLTIVNVGAWLLWVIHTYGMWRSQRTQSITQI
ncbi:hypothetical protein CCAX7_48960 [Capsulimonas corticalis]|uniref:Uncharacterized protein n=1 Tax=Capsulimonas corticalis TaxID=2219043 RepID=A0A402CPY1_9BACT|nr:hypothetical protein [Capsulimonas corticalis]BDI32845.1 hypothetical protein CCAX7_48960 [Capsulimonas corticalis]